MLSHITALPLKHNTPCYSNSYFMLYLQQITCNQFLKSITYRKIFSNKRSFATRFLWQAKKVQINIRLVNIPDIQNTDFANIGNLQHSPHLRWCLCWRSDHGQLREERTWTVANTQLKIQSVDSWLADITAMAGFLGIGLFRFREKMIREIVTAKFSFWLFVLEFRSAQVKVGRKKRCPNSFAAESN